ncbi:MAG: hypothetical protein WCO07_03485 [bacterium]
MLTIPISKVGTVFGWMMIKNRKKIKYIIVNRIIPYLFQKVILLLMFCTVIKTRNTKKINCIAATVQKSFRFSIIRLLINCYLIY